MSGEVWRPILTVCDEIGEELFKAEIKKRSWVVAQKHPQSRELIEIEPTDHEIDSAMRSGMLAGPGEFLRLQCPLFVRPAVTQSAEQNVRGRKPRLAQYVAALIAVIGPVYEGDRKPPKRQADVERWFKEYFKAKKLKVGETQIRNELARPLFKAFWEEDGN